MAFILESVEIKRLWPIYNRSQKGFEQAFGLYLFEDGKGFKRLVIDTKKKHLQPLYTFNLLVDGHTLLKNLISEYHLCPRLCFIDKSKGCTLAEAENLSVDLYNERVNSALEHLANALPSFAVVENIPSPKKDDKNGIILIEKGRFYGMGYVTSDMSMQAVEDIKPHLTAYPENGYIRGLVFSYASKFPDRKITF